LGGERRTGKHRGNKKEKKTWSAARALRVWNKW